MTAIIIGTWTDYDPKADTVADTVYNALRDYMRIDDGWLDQMNQVGAPSLIEEDYRAAIAEVLGGTGVTLRGEEFIADDESVYDDSLLDMLIESADLDGIVGYYDVDN